MAGISVTLWSVFNLVLLVFILFLIYKILTKPSKAELATEIIKKLDEIIKLNQQILAKNNGEENNLED